MSIVANFTMLRPVESELIQSITRERDSLERDLVLLRAKLNEHQILFEGMVLDFE